MSSVRMRAANRFRSIMTEERKRRERESRRIRPWNLKRRLKLHRLRENRRIKAWEHRNHGIIELFTLLRSRSEKIFFPTVVEAGKPLRLLSWRDQFANTSGPSLPREISCRIQHDKAFILVPTGPSIGSSDNHRQEYCVIFESASRNFDLCQCTYSFSTSQSGTYGSVFTSSGLVFEPRRHEIFECVSSETVIARYESALVEEIAQRRFKWEQRLVVRIWRLVFRRPLDLDHPEI